jgi:hypothetical protein
MFTKLQIQLVNELQENLNKSEFISGEFDHIYITLQKI